MRVGGFRILALVCCLGGFDALTAASPGATGDPLTPILRAPTIPSERSVAWEEPAPVEDDDDFRESFSDGVFAASSPSGLRLTFTASPRAPSHELVFAFCSPSELLYCLSRLRI